jgi:hypothetical protein
VTRRTTIWKSNDFPHASHPEKQCISLNGKVASYRHQVDENVRPKTNQLPPQNSKIQKVTASHRVLHVSVNKTGITDNRLRWCRYRPNREISQQHPLREWKRPSYEVKAWQRHYGIAQTAKTIDENSSHGVVINWLLTLGGSCLHGLAKETSAMVRRCRRIKWDLAPLA